MKPTLTNLRKLKAQGAPVTILTGAQAIGADKGVTILRVASGEVEVLLPLGPLVIQREQIKNVMIRGSDV